MSTRIYIGGLPTDISPTDVENLFQKFGDIRTLDLKATARPPAFAFIEFEHILEAERAVRERDGYVYRGVPLQVEVSFGTRGHGRPPPSKSANTVGRTAYSGPQSGAAPGNTSRHTSNRVLITNLPKETSWQDLKDHMRRAGEVKAVEVYQEGTSPSGIAEFSSSDYAAAAVRKLDKTEFSDRYGTCSIIRVKEYQQARTSKRARSHSRSRSPESRRSGMKRTG